jgi:ribosomal protein S13
MSDLKAENEQLLLRLKALTMENQILNKSMLNCTATVKKLTDENMQKLNQIYEKCQSTTISEHTIRRILNHRTDVYGGVGTTGI